MSGPEQRALPRTMRVAALIVGVEGIALFGLAVTDVVLILVKDPEDVTAAVLSAVFALLFAAVLVFCARGLRAMRRAAYAPVVLLQVLAIPVGVGLVQNERLIAAVCVLAPSLAVLVLLLLTPGGRAALEHGE